MWRGCYSRSPTILMSITTQGPTSKIGVCVRWVWFVGGGCGLSEVGVVCLRWVVENPLIPMSITQEPTSSR